MLIEVDQKLFDRFTKLQEAGKLPQEKFAEFVHEVVDYELNWQETE